MRKFILLLPLLFLLGCNAPVPDTPGAPLPADPPVVKVLKLTQLAAVTTNTAAHTLKVLCVPLPPATPALDPMTCSNTKVYLLEAANTFDKIVLITGTPDTWPVMRLKIIGVVGTAVTTSTVKDPALQAQINSIQNLVLQILEVK